MRGSLTVCDRCKAAERGTKLRDIEGWRRLEFPLDSVGREIESFDLCDRCMSDFERFLGQ